MALVFYGTNSLAKANGASTSNFLGGYFSCPMSGDTTDTIFPAVYLAGESPYTRIVCLALVNTGASASTETQLYFSTGVANDAQAQSAHASYVDADIVVPASDVSDWPLCGYVTNLTTSEVLFYRKFARDGSTKYLKTYSAHRGMRTTASAGIAVSDELRYTVPYGLGLEYTTHQTVASGTAIPGDVVIYYPTAAAPVTLAAVDPGDWISVWVRAAFPLGFYTGLSGETVSGFTLEAT